MLRRDRGCRLISSPYYPSRPYIYTTKNVDAVDSFKSTTIRRTGHTLATSQVGAGFADSLSGLNATDFILLIDGACVLNKSRDCRGNKRGSAHGGTEGSVRSSRIRRGWRLRLPGWYRTRLGYAMARYSASTKGSLYCRPCIRFSQFLQFLIFLFNFNHRRQRRSCALRKLVVDTCKCHHIYINFLAWRSMHRFDGLAPLCYVRLCLSSKAVTTFSALSRIFLRARRRELRIRSN